MTTLIITNGRAIPVAVLPATTDSASMRQQGVLVLRFGMLHKPPAQPFGRLQRIQIRLRLNRLLIHLPILAPLEEVRRYTRSAWEPAGNPNILIASPLALRSRLKSSPGKTAGLGALADSKPPAR